MSGDIQHIRYELAELKRKLANVILIGRIEQVDYSTARARCRIGELLTAPLPWLAARAGGDRTWCAPEIGEQVEIHCPCGDPSQGIIMGAIYQAAYPAPGDRATVSRVQFGDGATIEYDRAAHRYTIQLPDTAAQIRLISGGQVTIATDGDLVAAVGGSASVSAQSVSISGTTTFTDGVTIGGSLTVSGAASLQSTTIEGTPAVPGGTEF